MRLIHLEEAVSTQDVARALGDEGAKEWTVVWADRQSRGRGRLARRWESRPGGLYFSVILRPRFSPTRLADFSVAIGAALAGALARHAGIETIIKPPNDVLARAKDGRSKKICGVLCEARGDSRRLDWLVVGVGVNVNNAPVLKRAASLKSLTGKTWPIDRVLKTVLKSLGDAYAAFNKGA